jgi:hypothetical protein
MTTFTRPGWERRGTAGDASRWNPVYMTRDVNDERTTSPICGHWRMTSSASDLPRMYSRRVAPLSLVMSSLSSRRRSRYIAIPLGTALRWLSVAHRTAASSAGFPDTSVFASFGLPHTLPE